jgi:hypothetical protein
VGIAAVAQNAPVQMAIALSKHFKLSLSLSTLLLACGHPPLVPFLASHSECPRANGIRTVLPFNIQIHQSLIGLTGLIYLLFYPL